MIMLKSIKDTFSTEINENIKKQDYLCMCNESMDDLLH